MSNTYWDEEEDDDLDTNSGVQDDGSDLVKKLRKAKRADEKRIKELTDQLEGLSKVQKERTVKEVLENKGVNPKAVRLILKDLEEVTEESVNNWLEDNGDLFGLTQKEAPMESNPELAELQRQDSIAKGASTPSNSGGMDLDSVESKEELLALIYGNKL